MIQVSIDPSHDLAHQAFCALGPKLITSRVAATLHVARLGFVRRSCEIGFPLESVRDLLQIADQRGQDCTAIDELAREHLTNVEQKIADLTHLAHELRHVIGQCRGGKVSECRIIEALAPKART